MASPSTIPSRRATRPRSFASDSAESRPLLLARAGGALALLAMGALHLQQYLAEYSVLPTIGTLFLLNFIGGLAVGGALLIQPPRSLRLAATLRAALALAGVAMAVTAIAFLLISEQTPLFGFLEYGYRTPVVLALVFEGLAALMLTGYLLGLRRARHSRT